MVVCRQRMCDMEVCRQCMYDIHLNDMVVYGSL